MVSEGQLGLPRRREPDLSGQISRGPGHPVTRSSRSSWSSPVQSVSIECCSNLVEPLHSPVVPIGQLVVVAPAPRGEQRPHEDAALVNQVLISPG
jgi:hypothetical protein